MQDFAAAGYSWSEQLCKKDSDGDGYSNGEELGDPNCTVSLFLDKVTHQLALEPLKQAAAKGKGGLTEIHIQNLCKLLCC